MPSSPIVQRAAADLASRVTQPQGSSILKRLMLPLGVAGGIAGAYGLAKGLEQPAFEEVFQMAQSAEDTPLDRAEAEQAFESLKKFAPHIASDPTVAANFIRRAARYGALNMEEVLRLIESQWRYSQTQPLGSHLIGMAHGVGNLLTNIF